MSKDVFNPKIACHDCGSRPKWKFGPFFDSDMYCKRCHQKNGYGNAVAIDLDALEKIVGPKLARTILWHGTPTKTLP